MTTEETIEQPKTVRVAGFLAQYDSPADAVHAAEKVRDAGYTKWDVHTPFPVHGMDGAMGLKPTPMGWISLAGGLTGGSAALLMQWWMNGYDYPLNIGGKPAFAVQAFVPITFELTVLLTAFATLFGMLGLNRLPQLYHWAFSGKTFGRATDDLFFISIDAEDPKFDRELTKKLLDKTHPSLLEEIEEEVGGSSGRIRENVGLTVEAIAGISSPFQDKDKLGEGDRAKAERGEIEMASEVAKGSQGHKSEQPPPPATAKSTPPPAEEVPDAVKAEAHEIVAEATRKADEHNAAEAADKAADEAKADAPVVTESDKNAEKKDEPEAPKGGTEKS